MASNAPARGRNGLVVAEVTGRLFASYEVDRVFDEMLDARSQPRHVCRRLHEALLRLSPEALGRSMQQADPAIRSRTRKRSRRRWRPPGVRTCS